MNISKLLVGTAFLGIAFLRDINAFAAQGLQKFEVEGVMRIRQPHPALDPRSARFRLCVSGCQWAVRHIQETVGKDGWLLITETSDNGTNLHVVRHLQVKTSGLLSYDPTRAISNSWSAQIHSSGFPRWIAEPEIGCLFYAYASSCYLDTVTNNLLEPIRFSPSDFFYREKLLRANLARVSGSRSLPIQICFLDDSGVRTNAVLTSSRFTIGPGFQIPLSVVLTEYDGAGRPLAIYEFEGSSVKPSDATVSFNPELQLGTYVLDYRFYHGEPPFYQGKKYGMVISHGLIDHWPTEAEAELTPEYKVLMSPSWRDSDSMSKIK